MQFFRVLSQTLSHFPSLFVGDCAEQCQHGGTCVQGQCICPLNYEGENCENGNNEFLYSFILNRSLYLKRTFKEIINKVRQSQHN